jgi:hypothetical protein
LKKYIFVTGFFVLVIAGLIIFAEPDTSSMRVPASHPKNYDELTACEKQDVLWKNILDTKYDSLPEFRKFGAFQLRRMSYQEIGLKGSRQSDFAPEDWVKYLHARGSIAKVKIISKGSHEYTGLFKGADCALLRLSLTFKPTRSRSVAPGLALKVLRNTMPSANVSALVSLQGQEDDYNFFKNPLSNIVPVGTSFGEKRVHNIFKEASNYPEELSVQEMAAIGTDGVRLESYKSPRQIFFLPNPNLTFKSKKHDVREDFETIPTDTLIYSIYAMPEKYDSYDYVTNYKISDIKNFASEAVHIADIYSTSEFVSSAFGDDGIFFRHQLR